jgi:putative DNA primase/helicase
MREIVFWFLLEHVAPFWGKMAKLLDQQVVQAACIEVAVGKTQIAIEELSRWIHKHQPTRSIVYATDRHKLNERVKQRFIAQGIDALIFRGRLAKDPESSDGELMCLNEPAVRLAMSYQGNITKTCCKNGAHECVFESRCGYWRQFPKEGTPQVWLTAHDTLFSAQDALGEPLAVIIDEGLWDTGIRGLEEDRWNVAIDAISRRAKPPADFATLKKLGFAVFELEQLRCLLALALRDQKTNGGVEHEYLEDFLSPGQCKRALRLEWKLMPELGQYPGMTQAELQQLGLDRHKVIDDIRQSRRRIKIWEAACELLEDPNIAVSGRLELRQDNGQRCVHWHGIEEIKTQFQAPTLMLDATLPDEKLLRVYHPTVEVVAHLRVAMPSCVRVCQVLGAPTAATKLNSNETHLESVRRYILQRFIELGRPPTLVICQAVPEKWLRERGLPPEISLAHYNDIAGLDDYKHVRLLILVGRTQPGPAAVELLAGALTGRQSDAVGNGGAFAWYPRVTRGIRVADGSVVAVDGDEHPDPFAELVRQQICEAQLIQAIGRGRGINRTAADPLDIDLLFDTCLPITVDEVTQWQGPSLLVATAADEGVMLTAPCDLVKLWPQLWPHRKAATRTLTSGVPTLPGFVEVRYQLAGAKMNRRRGYFDPAVIPDPSAWLEAWLGPLAPS